MLVHVVNTIRLLLRIANKPKSAVRLEKDLREARRAEGIPDDSLWYDQETPNITRRNHGMNVADGAFLCKCGTENTLIHFRGAHPFKHLTCRACGLVFSKRFACSDILQIGVKDLSRHPNGELRIGQLCPGCGLTHRAFMKNGTVSLDTMCVCGSLADESWLHFSIGSPMDYWRNPVTFPQELKIDHTLKLIEKHNRAQQRARRKAKARRAKARRKELVVSID